MSPANRAFILLLIAAIAALWRVGALPMGVLMAEPSRPGPTLPLNSCTTTDLPQSVAAAHASSMVRLADGDLLVAWFAGSREGAADVTIEMAQIDGATITQRWTALDRAQLQRMSHRYISKLGNPTIWLDGDDRLHMWVVSVSVGGWSGSAVNHLISDDLGHSWNWGSRLILSPLFNLSTLVRTPPVRMSDGSIGLPCYHEFLHKRSLWVWLSSAGRVRDVEQICPTSDSLQPAVVALAEAKALAVMRAPSGGPRQVLCARSNNFGLSWQSQSPLSIPNPDSSVALLRLPGGPLLLAANPLTQGRGVLQLFVSTDEGASWKPGRVVESGAGEFSYPALALGGGGAIHLSYTFDRQHIRLRSFDRAWAEASAP